MQLRIFEIEEFLLKYKLTPKSVLLDTRSSAEFLKASIPGAVSLPLLDNESRAIIGTIYKKEGREAAVLKGFELEGPRFHEKIRRALELAPEKEVFIYCWRGGMRSNIMAWLLQMVGFKVTLLKGGYKTFRNWALQQFEIERKVVVLGGKTGSGKTAILERLQTLGEQVVDLEAIANHRGSAYGALGKSEQPSQEFFENLLAIRLFEIDSSIRVWMENESRLIGKVKIPNSIYNLICSSLLINIDVPILDRKKIILEDYGKFPISDLIEKTELLSKRMGPQNVKAAVIALRESNYDEWLNLVLDYYDRTYGRNSLDDNNKIVKSVRINWDDIQVGVQQILNAAKDK
jgi:tRNA 2-selenouridine synthase